jgi:hypothetical protein
MVRRPWWDHHERNAAVIRPDVREPPRPSIDRLLRANHGLDLSAYGEPRFGMSLMSKSNNVASRSNSPHLRIGPRRRKTTARDRAGS